MCVCTRVRHSRCNQLLHLNFIISALEQRNKKTVSSHSDPHTSCYWHPHLHPQYGSNPHIFIQVTAGPQTKVRNLVTPTACNPHNVTPTTSHPSSNPKAHYLWPNCHRSTICLQLPTGPMVQRPNKAVLMMIIPGSLPAKHTLGSCGHRFVLPSHNTVTVVLESRKLPMGQCNACFNVQPKYIMCNFSHCILHCGGSM